MITGPLRGDIDRLWNEFWTGGIANPLTVIEQISYLLFARLLDLQDQAAERVEQRTRQNRPRAYAPDEQHLRWSRLRTLGSSERVLEAFRDTFKHLKRVLARTAVGRAMEDAQFLIQKPALMTTAMEIIDGLPLERADLKGDIFEYVLSKLQQAGINGQFRTPRHVVDFMCDLVEPRADERIGDPACGTGGFLVGAAEWIRRKNTSPEGMVTWESGGEKHTLPSGDRLTAAEREHLQTESFRGFDFDATMLRLAAMNLHLHGVDAPKIRYQDALAQSFSVNHPEESSAFFDLILANPPFTGALDKESVHKELIRIAPTRKTELLFVALMLRMLKPGGRAAVIVPDGVLFGSTTGHKALRRALVEEHQLEAIVSLPSGVFKPYTGVSTAIVYFTRGGRTDHVFFYDVAADGYSLDDKRTERPNENDLPDALARWKARDPARDTDRTAKWFVVPKAEVVEKGYDLSINRYQETMHEEVTHEDPKVILRRLRAIEAEIAKGLADLEGML